MGQLKSSTDDYPYHMRESNSVGPGQPASQQPDVVPYVSLELAEKLKLSKSLRLQIRGTGITNTVSKTSPEKLYGDVPEGFLEAKLGNLKLRAGMNTVNWGVVDISSPEDVTNTSVLFHPLRQFKRGAPMAEAQWTNETFGFHAIYIPIQQKPLLPSTDSHWLPRHFLFNIEAENTKLLLPDFVQYEYAPGQTLDRALNDNYGLKLNAHVGRVDVQVTHFNGAAPSPKVHPTLTIDATQTDARALSPIVLSPVYYRVQTTGLGISWARDKWIWRAESAYQNSVSHDPVIQPWTWTSVLAVETNVEVGSTTMTWLAQYYYAKNPLAVDNLITSSYRIFDRTALLGTRWAISDALTVTLSALFETPDQGLFVMAGFEQKMTDVLKWGLSWRDFSAARDGIIKTYEHNDHATLDLTYYF